MPLISCPPFQSAAFVPPTTFTTWDPLNKDPDITLSGDLTAVNTSSFGGVRSVLGVTTGKYYWEYTHNVASPYNYYGLCTSIQSVTSGTVGADTQNTTLNTSGNIYTESGLQYDGPDLATNDVISVILNAVGKTVTFWVNGSPWGSSYGYSWLSPIHAFVADQASSNPMNVTANFGATPFVYTPPAGYYGLGV